MSGTTTNQGEVYEISNNYFENLRHSIGQVYTKQLNIFNNTFYKSFAFVSGRAERYHATGNVCDSSMSQFESNFDSTYGHSEIQIMSGTTIGAREIMKQRTSAAYRYSLKLQGQITPNSTLTEDYMPKVINFQLFVAGDYYSLDNGTTWKKLTYNNTVYDIDITAKIYADDESKGQQGLLLRLEKDGGTWTLRRRNTELGSHIYYNLKMTIDTYYGLGWPAGTIYAPISYKKNDTLLEQDNYYTQNNIWYYCIKSSEAKLNYDLKDLTEEAVESLRYVRKSEDPRPDKLPKQTNT